MKQALRCNCSPQKIIFDSPCKTISEIEFALREGVFINANSYSELEKIKVVLTKLEVEGVSSSSNIGLRINPMVSTIPL